jgi:hypothetical protein
MDKMQIAKKILEKGNCGWLECTINIECPLRSTQRACAGNWQRIDVKTIEILKQWIKDNEEKYMSQKTELKERYMTQQECLDWVVTIGYKNHNYRIKGGVWMYPSWLVYDNESICNLEYRTVELVDGEIHYGEPKEFKVKI